MYPDNALPEFYPLWLIELAEVTCTSLEEIHERCTPVMKAMGYADKGWTWAFNHGLLECFEQRGSL